MSTTVRIEKRKRTIFGQFVKWVFISFNVLMLLWLVSAMSIVSQMAPTSEAERAGHFIGATLGFSMILSVWVMGAMILALFVVLTRGDKVIIEETRGGYDDHRGSTEESDTGGMDADALIARYLQRQHAEATQPASAPPPTALQRSFGRRTG